MDQICSLMETTMRHKAGDSGLPIGLPLHWRTHFFSQCESLHVQCWFDEIWYVFDDDFPGDVESTESTTLDDVTWVVGFSRVDREGFIVWDVHVWTKKIQKHEPGSNKSVLIDAGEEARKVLIDQD